MDIRNFALRKTWLDSYLESPVSMDPLTSNIVNQPNHCPYLKLWRQLSRKKPLLVICRILRLFVNSLTADDMYALLNRDNLTQPIYMQLSREEKIFSWIFFPFLKSILTFNHFQKKMNLIVDVLPQLKTSRKVVK